MTSTTTTMATTTTKTTTAATSSTPAPNWAATCTRTANGTVYETMAACDDASKELVLATVTVTRQERLLAQGETCAVATSGFLKSRCTPRNGTVQFENTTDAVCIVITSDTFTERDTTHCDGKKQFSTYTTIERSSQS